MLLNAPSTKAAITLDLRGESFSPVPNAGEAGEVREAGGDFLLVGYFCQGGLESYERK